MPNDMNRVRALVRDVPDFPKPGIVFKDITPLLADEVAFSSVIDETVVHFGRGNIDKVVGISPGERVLIVDDVLATGGTARATARLVERLGGKVIGIATLIELSFLDGRKAIEGYEFYSLISY